MAPILISAVKKQLGRTGLDVGLAKRKNFLVKGLRRSTKEGTKETIRNVKRHMKGEKEEKTQNSESISALHRVRRGGGGAGVSLLFPRTRRLKLLGLSLAF